MLRQRLIEAFVTKMNGVGHDQAAYAADLVLGVLQANGISTQIAAPGASGHLPPKGMGHGAPVQKGYVDQKMGHGGHMKSPPKAGYVDQKMGHGAPQKGGYAGHKGGHGAPAKGGGYDPGKGGGGKGGGGKY